ncbi:MAG: N-glycosylase/DNA lyase [Aquificae bacterium]|nr:N-glycosylase/DNA lyase [Aquificota bacterium]
MKEALKQIEKAKKEAGKSVEERLSSFRELGTKGRAYFDFRPYAELSFEAGRFSELAFCLLTAGSSALLGLKAQAALGEEGFLTAGREELEELLKKLGHRWAGQRAERIVKARERFPLVLKLLKEEKDAARVRELLSSPGSPYKVEGLGLKEASHFLRNLGYDGLAIVDRHVLRFLRAHGLVRPLKTVTRKLYLEAEEALRRLARETGTSMAELDLLIFYAATGKVLK